MEKGQGGEEGKLTAMLDHTLTGVVVVAVWAFWRQYIKQQESTATAGVVAVLTLTEGEREREGKGVKEEAQALWLQLQLSDDRDNGQNRKP